MTAGFDHSPDVIGRGSGREQKYSGPMTRPVMEPFEKCVGRALAIPLNQTAQMPSACFNPKFALRNHERQPSSIEAK
jgi:hypothetical protein